METIKLKFNSRISEAVKNEWLTVFMEYFDLHVFLYLKEFFFFLKMKNETNVFQTFFI